jgi:serine/threonine protein kinase
MWAFTSGGTMVWRKGDRLQNGKYIIEGLLGKGGYGTTYKATQTDLERYVVIKTLNDDLKNDTQYLKRFTEEGKKLAILSKTPCLNIVAVIESFQEKDSYCLVMEFVNGSPLNEILRHAGKIPESQLLDWFYQIAEALAVIHQADLVHRDIKPHNIVVRRNGQAVLIDFGIAKAINSSTQTRSAGEGTELYTPWEQLYDGTSCKPTVDIYALAATMYHLITDCPPVCSINRMQAKRNFKPDPIIPPSQYVEGISDPFNKAILTGMAIDDKDRPQSIQAWLEMLERGLSSPASGRNLTTIRQKFSEWIVPTTQQSKTLYPAYSIGTSNQIFGSWIVLLTYTLISAILSKLTATTPTEVWIIAFSGVSLLAIAGSIATIASLIEVQEAHQITTRAIATLVVVIIIGAILIHTWTMTAVAVLTLAGIICMVGIQEAIWAMSMTCAGVIGGLGAGLIGITVTRLSELWGGVWTVAWISSLTIALCFTLIVIRAIFSLRASAGENTIQFWQETRMGKKISVLFTHIVSEGAWVGGLAVTLAIFVAGKKDTVWTGLWAGFLALIWAMLIAADVLRYKTLRFRFTKQVGDAQRIFIPSLLGVVLGWIIGSIL